VLRLKPSIFSPLEIAVCQLAPAPPANRQPLSFEENVDFNVVAPALSIPRVLTTFHENTSSAIGHVSFFAFKPRVETTLTSRREMS
jgi:hypothetical protein